MAVPITPWLATADPRWPTRQVVLDDLHCTVAVPADWQADEPEATDQEQSMTFLGASPVEWLTVRYLASGDGQLNQWLDTVLRAIRTTQIGNSR